MKLLDVVLLSLAVVFLVVGVHQGLNVGWSESYFIFMFSIALLFLYSYRRQQRNQKEDSNPNSKPPSRNRRRS